MAKVEVITAEDQVRINVQMKFFINSIQNIKVIDDYHQCHQYHSFWMEK